MPNLGSGDVFISPKWVHTTSWKSWCGPSITKETSEHPVYTGRAVLIQQKSFKMWGNYRQVDLGIEPARHRAVDKQAAKTINDRSGVGIVTPSWRRKEISTKLKVCSRFKCWSWTLTSQLLQGSLTFCLCRRKEGPGLVSQAVVSHNFLDAVNFHTLLREEETWAQSYTLLPEVTHSEIGLELRIKLGPLKARLCSAQTPLLSPRKATYDSYVQSTAAESWMRRKAETHFPSPWN